MTEKIAIDLGAVQKTMLLPLWGRAVETAKPRPLLRDPAAAAIAARLDYDFESATGDLAELTRLAWILRSLLIDRAARAFLARFPDAAVVNLGCGLDTTFERVDNGRLRWWDLDLPDAIALRRKLIPESERRRFIAASFLAPGWQAEIPAGPVFFIAAGLLYYFEEAQVRDFLIRLAGAFPGSEIVFDVCSPYGLKVANRAVIRRSGLDERSFLKWGLAGPRALTAWDRRLQLLATYYYFRGSHAPLPPRDWLLGQLSDLLGVQYLVHLRLGV